MYIVADTLFNIITGTQNYYILVSASPFLIEPVFKNYSFF